ncbi:MAG: RNA pseudouridine synthase [Treponema sp.]|jgi:23S rRNA pseudouridine1911/1915/1917 synthase|nr:RNA pseudouridine synthase [Treponema sp.]
MDPYRPLGEIPGVVDETESYAVLYKPPLMFSAPLGTALEATLLGWYARSRPAVLEPAGGKKGEGGLLHRLDFETEGLVLIAKTQEAYESLRSQQAAGDFVKEYLAVTCPRSPEEQGRNPLPGFPPPPNTGPFPIGAGSPGPETCIESFFRPWGPGRKAVRPVTAASVPGRKFKIAGDRGKPYRTEIFSCEDPGAVPGVPDGERFGSPRVFGLRIRRGFRHQIRCHLAWLGEPVLYDALYGGQGRPPDSALRPGPVSPDSPSPQDIPSPLNRGERRPIGLRAWAFHFFDPATGEQKDYRLPSF